MNILGIETSCDETACAIVRDGREVLSSVVYTQIKLHQPYGGVVPEIASRAHVEKISGVVSAAVRDYRERTGLGLESVDAVAVTYGPGLASSLLVGLAAAKGLALALDKPLYGINHIEAHLHTPFLLDGDEPSPVAAPEAFMPALGLAVSGGHTTWIDMPEYGSYEIIGQTLDDAAGEAFDKAAKLLGLGYPGGPVIDRVAKEWYDPPTRVPSGSDAFIPFPKGRPRPGVSALAGLDADFCTSFSGLKTALLHHVNRTYGTAPDRIIPALYPFRFPVQPGRNDKARFPYRFSVYPSYLLRYSPLYAFHKNELHFRKEQYARAVCLQQKAQDVQLQKRSSVFRPFPE